MFKNKVTIVSSDRKYLPIRALKVAQALNEAGYSAEILAWDRSQNKSTIEVLSGCNVRCFGLKVNDSNKLLFAFYPVWWLYVFIRSLSSDTDIYHPMNCYNLLPLIPIKVIAGKKIIYDLIDFTADSLALPIPIRDFLAGFENWCLKFTDGTIVVHPKKQMLNMLNIRRIAIIPTCPIDIVGEFKSNEGIDCYRLYYGGWISKTRGLEYICRATQELKNVKLVVAGSGPHVKEILSKFGNALEYKGIVDNITSLKLTSNADIIPVFYDPIIRINRSAVSAKLFDAMMCGKPVIVNSECILIKEIIENEGCGIIVDYGDVNAISNAIVSLTKNPYLMQNMGKKARNAFEREYNWDEMKRRLKDLYASVSEAAI